MNYDSRLVFTARAPEPGTRAATPGALLVEPKESATGTRRLRRGTRRAGRVALRAADRAAGGPVRGSEYNRGYRWWVQLVAGLAAILEGCIIIAIAAGVFGQML